MRKQMALLIVILICISNLIAFAEETVLQTRQEVIYLEGVEETVTTTYVESARGYSMWIDTEMLALQPEGEGNDMDVFMRPDTDDMRYQLVVYYSSQLGYTFEQAAQDVLQTMTDNYGSAEAFEIEDTFENVLAYGFYALDEDITILQYVVDAGAGVYYIAIMFPQEASEGFGSRVIQMLNSFEILFWNEEESVG